MTVGNLIALRQTNIVRMLAYSAIAQAGYILAPLAVVGQAGGTRVAQRGRHLPADLRGDEPRRLRRGHRRGPQDRQSAEISSFGGLFQYAPGLTVLMTVFLFALAGIPPLGGWFAKFVVFRALVEADTGRATRWPSSSASTR